MRSLFALLFATSAACGRLGFGDAPDAGPDAQDPNGVARLAIGAFTSCLVLESGRAWCWGDGEAGKLGDGVTAAHSSPTPAAIQVASPFVELDTNDGGSVGVLADGTLVAWGLNLRGAFGVGDTEPRPTPTPLPGVTDAIGAVITFDVVCAVRASGGVACAGAAPLLGIDATLDRATFGEVTGLSAVTEMSGGDAHVCALHASGAVSCWGANDQGQLGVPASSERPAPVLASSGPYTQIAAGDRFTCALRPSGIVDCWGDNGSGALGDATTDSRSTPAPVSGIADATMIASASRAGCALLRDRTVVCWGDNAERALGDATPSYRTVPGPPVIDDVRAIGAQSSTHVCAVKRDNSVWCWGPNYRGQLGNPIANGVIGPVPVLGLP